MDLDYTPEQRAFREEARTWLAAHVPKEPPTALHLYPAKSGEDRILNINADTSAGHIAKAVRADQLVFQTDVEGVLDARRRLIPRMTRGQAMDLIAGGIAARRTAPQTGVFHGFDHC